MRHPISILLAAATLALSLCGASPAAETWNLVGTWKITVQGERCAPGQIVRISAATAKVVDGTTNVNDTYGTIRRRQL
jgi:hypothetical protein